ncbi:MAG TPA: GAF domain-containing sensor histidine kinase [Terriglobales bacterium]|nr:GAF domain-containing sensor histidine kinase [Terriglobales bacterium]
MTVLPFKQSFHALIVEVSNALQPTLPQIFSVWRDQLLSELPLEPRATATLQRITPGSGFHFFQRGQFPEFFENLTYFGTRLSKLQVDMRTIQRALHIFEECCEPYISSTFGERRSEAMATLEMISSSAFVAVSGAYFDSRTRESTALLSILDAELAGGEIGDMLQRVLQITCASFDSCVGAFLLHDAESDLLKVEAIFGLGFDETMRSEFRVDISQGFVSDVFRSGEARMVLDPRADKQVFSPALRDNTRAIWAVPLRAANETIGVLFVGFSRLFEWMPTERNLLKAIADRSALAIYRARITQALKDREARIAELSAHLLRVQEEERKRISRELHDETGQGLMVIRLYLGMLDNELTSLTAKTTVAETLDVVDRTILGIRRIIGKLSPLVLQELGLIAAIRKEAKDLEKNHNVGTRVAISDEVGRLSPETETALYRIVQEALHNVAKHAQASHVNIIMGRRNDQIYLVVKDDGVGIFPRSNFRGNSFGLAGIKERVGMLGGKVRVTSLKGQGTRIEITVPATKPTDLSPLEQLTQDPAIFAASR